MLFYENQWVDLVLYELFNNNLIRQKIRGRWGDVKTKVVILSTRIYYVFIMSLLTQSVHPVFSDSIFSVKL